MNSHNSLTARSITKTALCIALLCISSYIIIPLPFTPIVLSMHTVAVNLVGLVLNPRQTAYTILIYLAMGLIGLPVFSGGSAGPDKLFGPTGGFYFGFLFAALAISFLKGQRISFKRYLITTIAAGIPIQHIFAIAFFSFFGGLDLTAAFLSASLPFIAGDIIKCVIASLAATALNKVL